MKRLGLIAGMLVLLFAVGSFAMQGSAQDDAVPVLQTQVADLQTRVAALEGDSATPVATSAGITSTVLASGSWRLTGTGQRSTEAFTVGNSETISITFDCVTDNNWIVLRNEDFNETQRLSDGQTIVHVIPQNTYSINVHCGDRWQLLITFWQ